MAHAATGGGGVKNHIGDLRTAHGWSQAELAERVDASRQTLNAIEGDRYDPSLPLAFRLAAVFDLPLEAVIPNPGRSAVAAR